MTEREDVRAPVAFGWAICFPAWSFNAGQAMPDSVRDRRSASIAAVVDWFGREGEAPRRAWKRLYRAGWRAARVTITTHPAYLDPAASPTADGGGA